MLLLQPFRGIYLTRIRQLPPDNTCTQYTGSTVLNISRLHSGGFRCGLLRRFDVSLENTASSVVNELMTELGKSLYPIILNFTSEGKIRDIENFHEIRERREAKATQLLKRFPTIAFRKYIEMSRGSLTDERVFRQVLMKDTFMQLFFSCASTRSFCHTCENFPRRGIKSSYYCRINDDWSDSLSYTVYPAFTDPLHKMEGEVAVCLSAEGYIAGINAVFQLWEKEGKLYKREINIRLGDDNETTLIQE